MAKRVSVKGKGADLFFGDYPAPPPPTPADEAGGPAPEDPGREPGASPSPAGAATDMTPSLAPEPVSSPHPRTPRRPSKPLPKASELANLHDSQITSKLSNKQVEDIEAIRRVVKTPGREVSFVRMTPKEKEQLADVVYTYKRRGLKTTETEINRIAINSLLADYRSNGERSVLARVLASLQS